MGDYGKIAALTELPTDAVLEDRVREAAQRVAQSGPALKPGLKKPPKAEIAMPDDFAAALAATPQAQATMSGLTAAQRRDYLEWITRAKQVATQEKRIAQAVEWLAEGKKRNWKYENC